MLKTSLRILLLALALPFAMPVAAQDQRPGIAVLPYEDGGSYGRDKEDFAALSKGIPAMLISGLSRNPAARVVERSSIRQMLDEQNLAEAGRVDAATAARIGKLVGARYMIMGVFTDFYGKFRIDSRIVDVETGEILEVVSVGPEPRDELYQLINSTAEQIMANTNLPPLPQEVATLAQNRAVPAEALTYYSRALLYQDRGETDKAIEFYTRALEVFPDYAEAREGLQRVQ
ncbi:MAG: CsgG/HfaB family protein [Gemmatimonadales bacterium]